MSRDDTPFILDGSSSNLQLQAGCQRLSSNDFISQVPDDVLVMILSILPVKDAVVTSSLSTRWRFLWRNLNKLNFDGGKTFHDMANMASVLEQCKFIDQVNSVIQSYNHPIVQDFRIRHGLKCSHKRVIDGWLQFAINKKVEFLELDLTGNCRRAINYDFPLRLFESNLSRSMSTVVELVSLKKLILKEVNVTQEILQEFLTNSPHLEMLSIHKAEYLKNIHIGGRALNLKHFEIVAYYSTKSIYLSDFDLVSFTYKGSAIDLRLADLPKLKELELDMSPCFPGAEEFHKNVFGQISSCASSLQSLSLAIYRPKEICKFDSFPELPNLKKLRLTIGGNKDKSLLRLASMVNACPNLESFTIRPLWTSPIISKKKARNATKSHEHLKLVQILAYYGRKCDFELVVYIKNTAVALKKIVIDPQFQGLRSTTAKNFSNDKEDARSSVKHELVPILPPGVELVIL